MQDYEMQVNDIFWSFQGEGYHTGRRTLFVRVPFCNLSCPWCDTDFTEWHLINKDSLLEIAKAESSRFAVITGGEPLMHKSTPHIVKILKEQGFTIAVETNGTYPIIDGIDWVTCSPKRQANYKCIIKDVNEFKYVVDDDFDFKILDHHDLKDGKIYFLTPEWYNMPITIKKIEAYIEENPDWRLGCQLHKFLEIK